MDNFAVVQIKNAQYKVAEGDVISVDRLTGAAGDKLKFDEVLLRVNKDKVNLGKPFIEKAIVNAEIVEHYRGEKVDSAIYKAKARYRRKSGARAELTKVKIVKIS